MPLRVRGRPDWSALHSTTTRLRRRSCVAASTIALPPPPSLPAPFPHYHHHAIPSISNTSSTTELLPPAHYHHYWHRRPDVAAVRTWLSSLSLFLSLSSTVPQLNGGAPSRRKRSHDRERRCWRSALALAPLIVVVCVAVRAATRCRVRGSPPRNTEIL